MRLSFMTFACPTWPLADVLEAARAYGYDGLEPRLDVAHAHGIEIALDQGGRRAVRAAAADSGIELCCLATSLGFAVTEPPKRAELLAAATERLRLAADLGAPGIRVFAGGVSAGTPLEEALSACAENLRAAGDVAADLGVELWLETHDTVSRGELAGQVVNAADHRAVHINYDILHPVRLGESLDDTFAALAGHIRHSHWHDARLRPDQLDITPIGEGELPLAEIVARLAAVGFEGYLSGEWFVEQMSAEPHESLSDYARAMRALMAAAG
jgi:sugar phosphate isomerase/epimerase